MMSPWTGPQDEMETDKSCGGGRCRADVSEVLPSEGVTGIQIRKTKKERKFSDENGAIRTTTLARVNSEFPDKCH